MKNLKKVVKKRLLAIDIAKGIGILSMVVLHYLFIFSELQLIDSAMIASLPYTLSSRVVAITFIALSTTVLWSRSHTITSSRAWLVSTVKQVAKLSLAALFVTLATKLWLDQSYVRFGILHFLAVATLINSLMFRLPLSRWWYVLLGAFTILVGNWLLQFSFPSPHWIWLGLVPADFASVDYVPVLPWLGLTWLTVPFVEKILDWAVAVQPKLVDQQGWRWLSWCGRHSLTIYLLHVPGLLTVLWLLHHFL